MNYGRPAYKPLNQQNDILYFSTGPDPGKYSYQNDSKAFIFSLFTTTGYNLTKFKIKDAQHAIFHSSASGPSFGKGHDLGITDGGRNSLTFVSSYDAPPGCGAFGSCPTFAGSYKFNPSDVEVFYEK